MKRKDEFRGAYAGSGLCLSFAFTDCYADFARWLNGLNPIIQEAEEELRNLRFFNLDDVEKKVFLEAAIMVLKAVIRLADRYAEAAETLAENEENRPAERRAKENCRSLSLDAGQSSKQLLSGHAVAVVQSTSVRSHFDL